MNLSLDDNQIKNLLWAYSTQHAKNPNTELPNQLALVIQEIAEAVGNFHQFAKSPYRDDMVSEAILNCLTYIHNYNPSMGENFEAYIKKICINAFKSYLINENAQVKALSDYKKRNECSYYKNLSDTRDYYVDVLSFVKRNDGETSAPSQADARALSLDSNKLKELEHEFRMVDAKYKKAQEKKRLTWLEEQLKESKRVNNLFSFMTSKADKDGEYFTITDLLNTRMNTNKLEETEREEIESRTRAYIKNLVNDGILTKTKRGRGYVYHVTDFGRDIIAFNRGYLNNN